MVGPLVDENAAAARAGVDRRGGGAGATLLTGGQRDGAHVAPAVLIDVPADAKLACEEVFGPVCR